MDHGKLQGLWDGIAECVKPDVAGRIANALTRARLQAGWTPGVEPRLTVENAGGEVAVMRLYAGIGPLGVPAGEFVNELDQVKSRALELYIDSPGGDVFDSITIYNALRRHPAAVTTIVDGVAASGASVVAMAGDKRLMSTGAMMMIHDAHGALGLVYGSAKELREFSAQILKDADVFDKFSEGIADIYAEQAGKATPYWRALMLEESWFNADEAVDEGLATAHTFPARGTKGSKNHWDQTFAQAQAVGLLIHNGPGKPAEQEQTPAGKTAADWRTAARLKVAASALEVHRVEAA